ncbi:MAG: methyltransferase domain-containing protein [Deltaproteobacteria bacterium]|nr:methyltransferase domain-containing protein [Deltaproteobacteria bacterium]
MADYDAIGARYGEAKRAPWRLSLEAYTLERLAGDLRGQRVLDLACGDGFYTRRMKARGAARALGVDLSAEMIRLARQAEAAQPLGCEYLVGDAGALIEPGTFDLVVAAYLLNYAPNRDTLRRMCAVAFTHLRPGGRLIGVNDYTADGAGAVRDLAAHGLRKLGPGVDVEGAPITYEFVLPEGRTFSIVNYYWRPDTYLAALREVGFRDPAWHRLALAPDASPSVFDDFRAAAPCAAFSARA